MLHCKRGSAILAGQLLLGPLAPAGPVVLLSCVIRRLHWHAHADALSEDVGRRLQRELAPEEAPQWERAPAEPQWQERPSASSPPVLPASSQPRRPSPPWAAEPLPFASLRHHQPQSEQWFPSSLGGLGSTLPSCLHFPTSYALPKAQSPQAVPQALASRLIPQVLMTHLLPQSLTSRGLLREPSRLLHVLAPEGALAAAVVTSGNGPNDPAGLNPLPFFDLDKDSSLLDVVAQPLSPPPRGTRRAALAPRARKSPAATAATRSEESSVDEEAEAEEFQRRHEIQVSGPGLLKTGRVLPLTRFEKAGFGRSFLEKLQKDGFTEPSPIQAQSWPVCQQGVDVISVARTGSGKTLGYLLPAFMYVNVTKRRLREEGQHRPHQPSPLVLVLAPTRELVNQIEHVVAAWQRTSSVRGVAVYGGAAKGPQMGRLRQGPLDLLVATPGRLNDFLEMGVVDLASVGFLVLDEADRMLDMGFEPQIMRILRHAPTERQTLFFTATWPKEVRQVASRLVVDPVMINVGKSDELAANKDIKQVVEVISSRDRFDRLTGILDSLAPDAKVMVFVSTKAMCDHVCFSLGHQHRAAAIHGGKTQNVRDHVLAKFREGRFRVLVATDVAARGLDIKDVAAVINYDFPQSVEDYVHRIGRTGRAGASGLAYTLFTTKDEEHAHELIQVMERSGQEAPPELQNLARGKAPPPPRQGFGYAPQNGRPKQHGSSQSRRGHHGRDQKQHHAHARDHNHRRSSSYDGGQHQR